MTRHLRSFSVRVTLSTMLAVSALSCATAWAAEPDVETKSVSVNLSDIDVFSPAGRAEARDRIAMAATRACTATAATDLVTLQEVETCREQAISTARSDLDQKMASARPANDASVMLAGR